MTASRAILLLLTVATVLMLQHYYPQMPDPMAAHFDGSGRPNGYQSRDGFFLLAGAIVLLVVVIFAFVGLLFRAVPTHLVNLPNRDYWLAPERRASTIEFMTHQMEWFGVGTMILLVSVLWLAMEANLTPDPTLDPSTMWWLLGAYFVFSALWLIHFVGKFRSASETDGS